MKTPKRTRSTSAESAVKAMLDAAEAPIAVPGHVTLRQGDAPFWDGILRARARDGLLAGHLPRPKTGLASFR